MGYSIIFETELVNLSDGRILMLQLQGCNNDESGRKRDEFFGKIYSSEEYEAACSSYKASPDEGFDLVFSGRKHTFSEYGSYLERKKKRAYGSLEELRKERGDIYARYLRQVVVDSADGVKYFSPEEWSSQWYDYATGKHGECKTTLDIVTLRDIKEIVDALDSVKELQFFIPKKQKVKKGVAV